MNKTATEIIFGFTFKSFIVTIIIISRDFFSLSENRKKIIIMVHRIHYGFISVCFVLMFLIAGVAIFQCRKYYSIRRKIRDMELRTEKNKIEKFADPDKTEKNGPLVTALMITGKDDKRILYSLHAITQFIRQDYNPKQLIILNHHPNLRVLDAFFIPANQTRLGITPQENEKIKESVHEIDVHKDTTMTLGALRNMSLAFVPLYSYWCPWDDDDWRSPDYISTLFSHLRHNNADAVAFTKRYEYNMNTNLAWMMQLKSGFPIILCRHHPSVKYAEKDSMEDIGLLEQLRELGLVLKVYENDPRIYIRLVHENNTSLFVHPDKTNIRESRSILSENYNYGEHTITEQEKEYIITNIEPFDADKKIKKKI